MVCEHWLALKLWRVNAGMCKSCTHCVEALLHNLIVGALLLLPVNGRYGRWVMIVVLAREGGSPKFN